MRVPWLLLALALVSTAWLQAAIEARTPNFRVITALDSEAAETAARELENFRAAYQSLGLAVGPPGAEPLAIVIFRDIAELESETGYQGGRPGFTRGFHQKGSERDFIAVAWDGGEPAAALGHEYTHQLFDPVHWPLWFREGMAEYLSQAQRSGNVLSVGGPLPQWVLRLLAKPWIPLRELLAAGPRSPWRADANFYPQCWLLAHWLVSQSPDLKNLDPGAVGRRIRLEGVDAMERELREHLAQAWEPRTSFVDMPVGVPVRLRPLGEGEVEFWIADLLRAMGRGDEARRRLNTLLQAYPELPEVRESLGAIAMDEGRYDEAEGHLEAAVAHGSPSAGAHYRLSLLLMRPVDSDAVERARQALAHARAARRSEPLEPRYILTEAQAAMVAGEWSTAAGLLGQLAALPDWQRQADIEFRELTRRKQVELRRPEPPRLAFEPGGALALAEPPAISRPPKPPPPSQVQTASGETAATPKSWPPPGTILLAGRIGGVECSTAGKFVTVHSNFFRTRLLIDGPVKLLHPPMKWEELPCGARGWVVNAAYRPQRGLPDARGVLVALVF